MIYKTYLATILVGTQNVILLQFASVSVFRELVAQQTLRRDVWKSFDGRDELDLRIEILNYREENLGSFMYIY